MRDIKPRDPDQEDVDDGEVMGLGFSSDVIELSASETNNV